MQWLFPWRRVRGRTDFSTSELSDGVEFSSIGLGSGSVDSGSSTPSPEHSRSRWYLALLGSIAAVARPGPKRDVLGYFTLVVFGSLTIITSLFIFTFLVQPWAQDRISGRTPIEPPWDPHGSPKDGLSRWPTDFSRDIIPIMVHSHNDYWREVPLFSALAAGCTGVEADVWLIDDELYVGHDRASLSPNRTLRNLYINPLVEILERQNPKGVFNKSDPFARARGVFDTSPNTTLVLLIDVKTNAPTTWPIVLSQLAPLREQGWLTHYVQVSGPCSWNASETCWLSRQEVWPQPVTVVGTGNLDFETYYANRDHEYSDTFMDAPLGVLPKTNEFHWNALGSGSRMLYYPENSHYASVSFKEAVGDVSFGFSDRQLAVVREQIRIARLSKLQARYWDLPSWPIGLRDYVWDVLTREGVGMLSVDDLEAAARRNWSWSRDWKGSMVWMVLVSVYIGLLTVGVGILGYRLIRSMITQPVLLT